MAARTVGDLLFPDDSVFSFLDAENQLPSLPSTEPSTGEEEDEEERMDSGYSSGQSRSQSESSDSADPWFVHAVVPSTNFINLSPWPHFDIWSPTTEDDPILQRSHGVAETVPSHQSSSASSVISSTSASSEALSPVFTSESSDDLDWGSFESWEAVPTVEEAEVLLQLKYKEEEIVHARAAQKRQEKKRIYFEKLHQRMKN